MSPDVFVPMDVLSTRKFYPTDVLSLDVFPTDVLSAGRFVSLDVLSQYFMSPDVLSRHLATPPPPPSVFAFWGENIKMGTRKEEKI
jgi:hypothetical protein